MNTGRPHRSLAVFAAGAAHIDRRGRSLAPFENGASNPGRTIETVGGAVFNAIRAARALTSDIRLVSPRGGDGNAMIVENALRSLDIEDIAMTWLDRRTPTYTALLDSTGDLIGGIADMQLYDLMRPRVFDRRHIRHALADADIVILDANLPVETIERLVERAGAKPVFAIGVSPAKVSRLRSVLSRLAAIFVSKAEAAQLTETTGATPISEIANLLVGACCSRAVLTDGPRPAAIIENGVVLWQRPTPVSSVQDVTGAGDTLAGIAMLAFATGSTFLESARLGMAAASLHVSQRDRDLDIEEIRSLAAALRSASLHHPDERTDVT